MPRYQVEHVEPSVTKVELTASDENMAIQLAIQMVMQEMLRPDRWEAKEIRT